MGKSRCGMRRTGKCVQYLAWAEVGEHGLLSAPLLQCCSTRVMQGYAGQREEFRQHARLDVVVQWRIAVEGRRKVYLRDGEGGASVSLSEGVGK